MDEHRGRKKDVQPVSRTPMKMARRNRPRSRGRYPVRWLSITMLVLIAPACAPDAPEGGIPTHPSDRYSVTLAWDAPATDAMGNTLTDLGGFRLYRSPSMPADGPDASVIELGKSTQFTVENLEPGVYFFAVTAVDETGNESELSQELRVEVGGP